MRAPNTIRLPYKILRIVLVGLLVIVGCYVIGSIRMLQQNGRSISSSSSSTISMKERFVAAAAAWMDGRHDRMASTHRGLATLEGIDGTPFEDDTEDETGKDESLEYEIEMRELMKEMNDTDDSNDVATTTGDAGDVNEDDPLATLTGEGEGEGDDEDDEEDPEEAEDIVTGTNRNNNDDIDEEAPPAPPSNDPFAMFKPILPSQFDIVYTYVNKTASKTLTSHFKSAKKDVRQTDNRAAKSARYRDRGELCFSLRSVEKFLPWFTGNIHIVTSTIPEWLDTSHPRIRVVTEESIMKPDHLPTYNSMAVEASIPNIRDLNDFYLYFNDDFFLARHTPFEAFTGESNRCNVFYPLPDDLDTLPNKGPHRAALHNANKLIDRHFGIKKPRPRYDLAHIPHVFNTSLIREISNIFGKELEEQSSHQFRSKADLHMAHLYAYYLRESPNDGCTQWKTVKPKCDGKGPYCFSYKAGLRNFHRELTGLKTAAKQKRIPNFINLNDREADPRLAAVAQKWTYEFLVRLYPKASSFEKYDCRRHYRHFPVSKYDLEQYKEQQRTIQRKRARAMAIRRARQRREEIRQEERRLERLFGRSGKRRN